MGVCAAWWHCSCACRVTRNSNSQHGVSPMANILSRRSFLNTGARTAAGLGLASLMNIPPFLKRALAEGNIGISGKKLLFIFLRGGNDGANNVIPIMDPSYRANRNVLGIPKHPAGDGYY